MSKKELLKKINDILNNSNGAIDLSNIENLALPPEAKVSQVVTALLMSANEKNIEEKIENKVRNKKKIFKILRKKIQRSSKSIDQRALSVNKADSTPIKSREPVTGGSQQVPMMSTVPSTFVMPEQNKFEIQKGDSLETLSKEEPKNQPAQSQGSEMRLEAHALLPQEQELNMMREQMIKNAMMQKMAAAQAQELFNKGSMEGVIGQQAGLLPQNQKSQSNGDDEDMIDEEDEEFDDEDEGIDEEEDEEMEENENAMGNKTINTIAQQYQPQQQQQPQPQLQQQQQQQYHQPQQQQQPTYMNPEDLTEQQQQQLIQQQLLLQQQQFAAYIQQFQQQQELQQKLMEEQGLQANKLPAETPELLNQEKATNLGGNEAEEGELEDEDGNEEDDGEMSMDEPFEFADEAENAAATQN